MSHPSVESLISQISIRPSFETVVYNHDLMKDVYEALLKDDTSEVVMAALQVMRKIKMIPQITHRSKDTQFSESCRSLGNRDQNLSKFQEALQYYNEALMFAPADSEAMKLAYGNRSLVFFKTKHYKACIKDIKTALDMKVGQQIDEKLTLRLREAERLIKLEPTVRSRRFTKGVENFYKIGSPHPNLPFLSSTVDMFRTHQGTRLMAKTDIKPGTIVAIDEAYSLTIDNSYLSSCCYYCSKKELNAIPCDGCCKVLFCNDTCKQKAMDAGHRVLCQIIELLDVITGDSLYPLVFYSTIKLQQSCKSWDEFIGASRFVGRDRAKRSSAKRIYDSKDHFSLLCFESERLFAHGAMVKSCFSFATLLHYLDGLENYLPETSEAKERALRALGRVMMYLINHTHPVNMFPPFTCPAPPFTRVYSPVVNNGIFSLLGKLPHACLPNCLAINLNRRMAIVACNPIPAGSPLTVHYLGCHVSVLSMNTVSLFAVYGLVCNCCLCTGKSAGRPKQAISDQTRRHIMELNYSEIIQKFDQMDVCKMYSVMSNFLTILRESPLSDEYERVKQLFVKCLITFADFECENIVLSKKEETVATPLVH